MEVGQRPPVPPPALRRHVRPREGFGGEFHGFSSSLNPEGDGSASPTHAGYRWASRINVAYRKILITEILFHHVSSCFPITHFRAKISRALLISGDNCSFARRVGVAWGWRSAEEQGERLRLREFLCAASLEPVLLRFRIFFSFRNGFVCLIFLICYSLGYKVLWKPIFLPF